MKRKDFISVVIPLYAAISTKPSKKEEPEAQVKTPPYLQAGDTIGITCIADFISPAAIAPAVAKLKEWGFKIIIGDTIGKKDFTFGGTDDERLKNFQQMMDNRNIQAILSARGGYGAVRIIDRIDFKQFMKYPKWIIGFSDITVLHSHVNRNYNIATVHSKMCNSFPDDWDTAEAVQKDSIESIRRCLSGEKMSYSFLPNINNRTGIAKGSLVGGNLKTLESLAGSKSDLITKNKILFVEDTGEYLYSIDRMFWNLKRTGKLASLAGLVVGGFKIKKDDTGEEFGYSLEQIVIEKVKEYNYPVCFDFPVGHQKDNVALKCGVKHILTVNLDGCTLTEIP